MAALQRRSGGREAKRQISWSLLIYLARDRSPGRRTWFVCSISVRVCGGEPSFLPTTYTRFVTMLGPVVLITALVAGASAGCTKKPFPPDEVDKLAKASLPKLKEWLAKNPQGGCTLETAIRRKEW